MTYYGLGNNIMSDCSLLVRRDGDKGTAQLKSLKENKSKLNSVVNKDFT